MNATLPYFSIVIPTYNRPKRLAECLNAITQLDYPRDRFEVVVVDDGSSLPLDEAIAPYIHLNLTLHRQSNSGPATARNRGAKLARGEYLAFTDDDCRPYPDWLNCFARRFAETPQAAIGGCSLNALPDNLFSTASQTLIDYLYGYYNQKPCPERFFTSNNLAMPAREFRTCGGFDEGFPLAAGEDRELCERWQELGYPMVYAPEACIDHAHTLTWRSFWRQQFNYGRGAYHVRQARQRRQAPPMSGQPLSFYWQIMTYPWVKASTQPGILLSPLMFVSQVAVVAGFTWEKQQQGRQALSESVS